MIGRVAAVTIGLLLCGCANRIDTYRFLTPEPVGNMPGDTIEYLPGAVWGGRPVTAISVVRAFEAQGKLNVCGALIMFGNPQTSAELQSYANDQNSRLYLGDANSKVEIRPSFMRFHVRDEPPEGKVDPKQIDYKTIEGNCVGTDKIWNQVYRTNHSLRLVKTTYTQGYAYMPVYVPRGR